MPALLILCFCLLLLVGYMATLYNGLVRVRNEVRLAWANIDVLLVQRHEELPKLVAVCQGYMQHERDTLEQVVRARSQVEGARAARNVPSVSAAESALRTGLTKLYAVVENYPELKANDLFLNLQTRISALETAIADRREIYNDAANAQNIRIESFPDSIVASSLHFKPAPFLKFGVEQTSDVELAPAFGR